MGKWIVAGLMALMLSGCAALQEMGSSAELPVKYGTLKLIEQSDDITAQVVVDHVDRIRRVVEANEVVDLARLAQEFYGPIDMSKLDASDRLLVDALVGNIQQEVEESSSGPDDTRIRILTLLQWVEDAATLYAD